MRSVDFQALLKERGMRLVDVSVRLGVDKSAVTRWAQGRIPAERVRDVERETGIPRERLRPDLFGDQPQSAE